MDRPWFQLHTRDLLDCKELARVSPEHRYILVALMCLAHEGKPYGFLTDSVGILTEEFMAARCTVKIGMLRKAIAALEAATRLMRSEQNVLYVPRMVRDEEIRAKRAAGGHLGGNPKLAPEGYPYTQPSGSKQGYPPPRARADTRSDSDSSSLVFSSSEKGSGEKPNGSLVPNTDAAFQELIGVFLACGIGISEPDTRRCATIWVGLELGQKIQALSVAKESAIGEWRARDRQFIPRPWNFLSERHFERGAPPRIIPKASEKQAGFERAAARFLAGDKDL